MAGLMSMRDIAGLARVQRPVVTMWRRRSRASAQPFPAPREQRAGQEFFARDDVVAWLEQTGRGNNPDARVEAAAHALLDAAAPADLRAPSEAVSALLALRSLTGMPVHGLPVGDLLDLADSQDPDDTCLYTELERVDDLPALARAADDLVDAAWSVEAAHNRLLDTRFRTDWLPLKRAALDADVHRLVIPVLAALARDLGEGTRLMDPTGSCIDLLAAAASGLDVPVLLMNRGRALHRLTRRQLVISEVAVTGVDPERGNWQVVGPVVHLVVLPDGDHPGVDEIAQLDFLDEVAGQLDDRQVALVLGPAATLTDPLEGEALQRRDQLLREGRVRSAVRLPAGLRLVRPREAMGLWLVTAPDVAALAERRTSVADLSAQSLTPRVVDGLASDLLAAWQGAEGARRRAWAHLLPVHTAELVSRSGSLARGRPQPTQPDERSGADWIVGLTASDSGGLLAGYDLQATTGRPELVTLGQAVTNGWVRVLPGHKLDVGDLPPGGVEVIGRDELLDGRARRGQGSRSVDRFAVRQFADRLTEPGDVVFTARGGPRALVDTAGGSLVLSPVRILRLNPKAPLSATAIATRINAATTATWRTWTVSTIAVDDRDALGAALADVAAERDRLAREVVRLDALAADLTAAVESRRVHITMKEQERRDGTTTL